MTSNLSSFPLSSSYIEHYQVNMSLSQEVLDAIQDAHIEQLRGFALPTEDLTAEDGQWVTKQELLDYIKDHIPAVQAAQASSK